LKGRARRHDVENAIFRRKSRERHFDRLAFRVATVKLISVVNTHRKTKDAGQPMKQLYFLTILILILGAQQAFAGAASREILVPESPVIEIVVAGDVLVSPGDSGEITISGSLTSRANNKTAAKDHIRFKATKAGAKIETDHFSQKKFTAKTQILIPADAALLIKIARGTLKLEKIEGDLKIRQKGGTVTINGHRGDINVDMSKGKLDISEYLGEGRSVVVEGKKGDVSASIGAVEVGPGRIEMKKGNIHFQIDHGTKVAVHARITKRGAVKSGEAVTRTDPATAFFTANDGHSLWELSCGEGAINLVIPRHQK
jgi:hypothetical protein